MRRQFIAHYPLNDEELERLWSTGIIVLDANVLLNLYRYSPQTRDSLISLLRKAQHQLWLPHQAGLEFHRTRHQVILAEAKNYDDLNADFAKLLAKLDETRGHPFTDDAIREDLHKVAERLREDSELRKKAIDEMWRHDRILEEVTSIYNGRVGEPFSEQERTEICQEGVKRFANKIPPGFKDASKPDERKFGDLILWKQVLRKAEAEKCPVLLVTGDAKTDWWLVQSGRTVGPHPAMKEEIVAISDAPFHMYDPTRFMDFGSKHFRTIVGQDAIEEIKQTQQRQARLRRDKSLFARRIAERRRAREELSQRLDRFQAERASLQERRHFLDAEETRVRARLHSALQSPVSDPETYELLHTDFSERLIEIRREAAFLDEELAELQNREAEDRRALERLELADMPHKLGLRPPRSLHDE